jgi:Na+/H+ antiporter NhaC
MTIGALILGLAVTMGEAAKALHTSAYLVGLFGDALPAVALPAVLTLICMGIAFATGTSFGTYAVVMPVALPMAWHLVPDPTYLKVCFGAVIGGAVYGDQCSPVSGCDLMDHTRTQLPLATVFAGLGAVASTIAAALVLA